MNKCIEESLTRIIIRYPMNGILLLTLNIVEDNGINYCALNGDVIHINPNSFAKLSMPKQDYVLLNVSNEVIANAIDFPIGQTPIGAISHKDELEVFEFTEEVEYKATKNPGLKDKLINAVKLCQENSRGISGVFNDGVPQKLMELSQTTEEDLAETYSKEKKSVDKIAEAIDGGNFDFDFSKMNSPELFHFSILYAERLKCKEFKNIDLIEVNNVMNKMPTQYIVLLFRYLSNKMAVWLTNKEKIDPITSRVMKTLPA